MAALSERLGMRIVSTGLSRHEAWFDVSCSEGWRSGAEFLAEDDVELMIIIQV